jgi:tol-pal system protein YbgF
MIDCKKHGLIILLLLPLVVWAEASVEEGHAKFTANAKQQGQMVLFARLQPQEPMQEEFSEQDFNGDEGEPLVKESQDDHASHQTAAEEGSSLLSRVDALQKEVQELRGQLEVQTHELKQLQQQQLSFYKDLDARLGGAKQQAKVQQPSIDLDKLPVTKPTTATVVEKSSPKPNLDPIKTNPAEEQITYMAAYELVKDRQFDEAMTAMQNFIQTYPKGGYTANAVYWLGELYLVKKDYAHALERFDNVVQQFPTSAKAAASLLKSGYAFMGMGDAEAAKKRFQQVMHRYPDTPIAQLAYAKLKHLDDL